MLGSASATAYAWCRVRASHRRWGSSSHFSASASPPTSCRSTSSCSRNSRSHRPARSSATRSCARSLRGCLTDPCEFGVPQMDEPYARFSRLKIDRPHPRVLRVVMNRPDKLNAADREMHSNLRIGLVSLAVPDAELQSRALDVAVRLAEGAPNAIRWTKYALNNWLRAVGPIFDASLGMEFLGFSGAELPEGVAALREKRPPRFPSDGVV